MSTELAWKPRDSRLTHLACGDTIPATFGLFSVPALPWVSLRAISRQSFCSPDEASAGVDIDAPSKRKAAPCGCLTVRPGAALTRHDPDLDSTRPDNIRQRSPVVSRRKMALAAAIHRTASV